MASIAYVRSLIRRVPDAALQQSLGEAFAHVLDSLRLGRCAPLTRAENFQLYAIEGTTDATPGTEFSIAHGLQKAPYVGVPILDLSVVGGSLVPLTVTSAADDKRVYLSSSVAGARVRLLVEG